LNTVEYVYQNIDIQPTKKIIFKSNKWNYKKYALGIKHSNPTYM